MNFKFEIGMILGIAGVVNLFIAFMDSEFALIWILFSFAVILGLDIWLLKRKITTSEEKKSCSGRSMELGVLGFWCCSLEYLNTEGLQLTFLLQQY